MCCQFVIGFVIRRPALISRFPLFSPLDFSRGLDVRACLVFLSGNDTLLMSAAVFLGSGHAADFCWGIVTVFPAGRLLVFVVDEANLSLFLHLPGVFFTLTSVYPLLRYAVNGIIIVSVFVMRAPVSDHIVGGCINRLDGALLVV